MSDGSSGAFTPPADTRAFALTALPGGLRNGFDAQADARSQQAFAAIDKTESDAIDFKMELRRNIHLALWHAMIACEEQEEAAPILAALGGMLVAWVERMPLLGWRLAADALAHIQLRCLSDAAASTELARETNAALFTALRQNLPREISEPMMAHANQAVIAWQRARRAH